MDRGRKKAWACIHRVHGKELQSKELSYNTMFQNKILIRVFRPPYEWLESKVRPSCGKELQSKVLSYNTMFQNF